MDEERQTNGLVSTSNPAVDDEYVETVDGDYLPSGEAHRLCTRYKSLCLPILTPGISCSSYPSAVWLLWLLY